MPKKTATTASPAPPAPERKRRDLSPLIHGVYRELPGGGWVRLVSSFGNLEVMRKRDQLEAAARERLGLTVEDELPLDAVIDIGLRQLVGTSLLEWGDFFIGDEELVCRRPDGSIDEDAGMQLLTIKSIQIEIEEALQPLNAVCRRNREVAEGNSEVRSAGN